MIHFFMLPPRKASKGICPNCHKFRFHTVCRIKKNTLQRCSTKRLFTIHKPELAVNPWRIELRLNPFNEMICALIFRTRCWDWYHSPLLNVPPRLCVCLCACVCSFSDLTHMHKAPVHGSNWDIFIVWWMSPF